MEAQYFARIEESVMLGDKQDVATSRKVMQKLKPVIATL